MRPTRTQPCPRCGDPDAEFTSHRLSTTGLPLYRSYCDACRKAHDRERWETRKHDENNKRAAQVVTQVETYLAGDIIKQALIDWRSDMFCRAELVIWFHTNDFVNLLDLAGCADPNYPASPERFYAVHGIPPLTDDCLRDYILAHATDLAPQLGFDDTEHLSEYVERKTPSAKAYWKQKRDARMAA